MILRNYQDQDFQQLEQLLKDTKLYHEYLDKKEILKRKIEYDQETIIIAEENKKIIGIVFIVYDPWASFIYHLGVHPNYRNKGLGNKLMEEAEKRLKDRGIKRITLFIEDENQKVIKFYKKRGWFELHKLMDMEKDL